MAVRTRSTRGRRLGERFVKSAEDFAGHEDLRIRGAGPLLEDSSLDQFLHVLLRCRVRLTEESSRGQAGDERVGEQQIDQADGGARPAQRTDPR